MLLGLCVCGAMASAQATAATADSKRSVLSSFELKGSHGYTLEVASAEGPFPAAVLITAKRGHLRASYEVPGEAGPSVQADLGLLGSVAVDFERRKRTINTPAKGCVYITETGVFRGSVSFTGEGDYTAAEATSIPGKVTQMPKGFCGIGGDRVNPRVPDFLAMTSLTARERTNNGFVEFGASASKIGSWLDFHAGIEEHLGEMTISRSASTGVGGDDALHLDKRTHSITLDPPPPFTGSARFQAPPGGAPTWTGPLSVSLPGAPGIALAGPSFAAKFCPSHSLLRECKVRLP